MNSESDNCANNPPLSFSHTQREKYIRTKHTIKNPSFFDTDKLSNNFITNHKNILFIFYQM